MRDYDIWTYNSGLIFTFLQNYSIYANIGTGFQLPKNEGKYAATAPDESEFTQWEIGFKASPIEQIILRYAYFQSKNTDEITGSLSGSTWSYSHQGESRRNGHEIEVNLIPYEGLQLFGAYTYQEATYEEGTNADKWVPAVPENILKLGAEYVFPFGTAVRCWYNNVGRWYTNSSNTASYGGYEGVDLKLSHCFAEKWTAAFDVKNLLDESYSEYVTSSSGNNIYSGSNGRYFQLTLKYVF